MNLGSRDSQVLTEPANMHSTTSQLGLFSKMAFLQIPDVGRGRIILPRFRVSSFSEKMRWPKGVFADVHLHSVLVAAA